MKPGNFRKPGKKPKSENNAGRGVNPARERFERAATAVGALGREELIKHIKEFKGRFKLDFTAKHLNTLPEDRLRHILLAALINAGKPR